MERDCAQGPGKDRSKNPPGHENGMDRHMLTACELLSSERYQAFVENMAEGVYEVDIDGNFLYFNDSLCRIFGYPREEIQFRNFTRFVSEEDAARMVDAFRRICNAGEGVSALELKINHKTGTARIVELSAGPIRNPDGGIIGFRGIVRDVTDRIRSREEVERSERRYRTLLDFVPYPIVVFTTDGLVSYVNPAFSETFGWTLEELKGKTIPYVPPELKDETSRIIQRLLDEKVILHHETRRLTKDGRVLDVVMRGAVYSEGDDEMSGELVILRDITREKRIALSNEAMRRISMALPEYPDLEDLLDYISGEIKRLLKTEGALVVLLDDETDELFFKSAAHDDSNTERRMKEVRFSASKGVTGRVVRTGRPVIVADTSRDPDFNLAADMQAGLTTRSLLAVPLRSKDRIIGVLCAINKKTPGFDQTDVKLLNMIAGTVALSVENARFSDEIRAAYKELASLNRAKDRVINHLSHELKTPLAVLRASLNILGKKLSHVPEDSWHPTLERAQRNLDRMLEMQYQVEDIMRERHYHTHDMLSMLLDLCADELASLVAEEVGEGPLVERIRHRIDDFFGPRDLPSEDIFLDQYLARILKETRPLFSHRQVKLVPALEPVPAIRIPEDALKKVVVGLLKNAVENTPDEGKIEIFVRPRGGGVELVVRDYGVGITPENQRRIFEGFFTTQETLNYSSKRPYDFNAGGKGADLLRMKIFSERYNFRLEMSSSRCVHIPHDGDVCPGSIRACEACGEPADCYASGGTTFTIYFPAAS